MTVLGYNPNDSYFQHPYGSRNNGHTLADGILHLHNKRNMTATIPKKIKKAKKKLSKRKKGQKAKLEKKRLENKANSPGVPPNTCPYIDMVITMVGDLQSAYERLREKGEYQPMVDRIAEQTKDMLEYVRNSNETLRDNSAFWYEKYKDQL
jgi:hypothetical protein